MIQEKIPEKNNITEKLHELHEKLHELHEKLHELHEKLHELHEYLKITVYKSRKTCIMEVTKDIKGGKNEKME